MKRWIVFDMLDYWHCGAGHGSGRYLDAVVARTPSGLPYVPGRTVRGLARDVVYQCERLGHLEQGITETLFGSELPDGGSADRFSTKQGIFQVGDAILAGAWESWIRTEQGRALRESFFETIASTKLDENRVASEHTLRRIEVAVPCTLRASWSASGHEELAERAFEVALPLLRRLGSNRHRGMGRARVRCEKEEA